MWQRSCADVDSEIVESNPDLADFLIGRTTNSYTGRFRVLEEIEEPREMRLNFLGGILARNRNQHFMPKHQLLLAVQAKHEQLNVFATGAAESDASTPVIYVNHRVQPTYTPSQRPQLVLRLWAL